MLAYEFNLIMTNLNPRSIITKDAPKPVGPYSQGVIAGDLLYCSGQIPLNPSTGEIVGNGNIEKETKQVLSNLSAVLNAAGANTEKVIRTTIYLIDLKDFEKVNEIYSKFFMEGVSPARACVQVAALPKGARIEIDCIAYLG